MFEVGKEYHISTVEWSDGTLGEKLAVWRVEEIDGALLKLSNPHSRPMILNTSSPHFVSAEALE